MKQFLCNMTIRPVMCLKEGILLVTRSLRTRAKALVIMMTAFVSSWIVADYLAGEHPTLAVLVSLLSGFAPLIGLCVFLIVVALLILLLICAVERTLAIEEDKTVPEPPRKSKWHRVAPFPPDLLAYCLSLKEHSPPAVLFSY